MVRRHKLSVTTSSTASHYCQRISSSSQSKSTVSPNASAALQIIVSAYSLERRLEWSRLGGGLSFRPITFLPPNRLRSFRTKISTANGPTTYSMERLSSNYHPTERSLILGYICAIERKL
jgi:hypothetical protein